MSAVRVRHRPLQPTKLHRRRFAADPNRLGGNKLSQTYRLSLALAQTSKIPEDGSPSSGLPPSSSSDSQTDSLSSLAARNATFLLALIWMGSPVAGLRPMRAARLRTCRMPSPPMRMRSPFLRCLVTRPTRSPSTASVCFFDISWDSERFAARCFRVTVAGVPGFFAAMAGPPIKRGGVAPLHHDVALDDSHRL